MVAEGQRDGKWGELLSAFGRENESLLAVQWPHCSKRVSEALLTKIKGTGRARKVLPAVKILEKQ